MDIPGILTGVVNALVANGTYTFLYYDVALLAAALVSILLVGTIVLRELSGVKRRTIMMLVLLLAVFFLVEELFVAQTQQMYSDEYIHDGIAKNIFMDHNGGICSFSSITECVPDTAGLFQQPIGWATMMASAFVVAGATFQTTFNLSMIISLLIIFLVFLLAYLLIQDEQVALLSAVLFAATPLFMTYARSTVLDIPSLAVSLLAICMLMVYMRQKGIRTGIAVVTCTALALVMKVDAIIILPIMLVMLLSYEHGFSGRRAGRQLRLFALLFVMLLVLISPQLAFLYNSDTTSTFGQLPGAPKFSISILSNNTVPNIQFWLDSYESSNISMPAGYYWHAEYPVVYTVLAIVGVGTLLYRRRIRQASMLCIWFVIVFTFYSAYYAGSVTYGIGSDMRYYLLDFPVIAILAAVTLMYLYRAAATALRGSSPQARSRRRAIMAAILLLALAEPAYQFVTIVTLPTLQQAPFAAERAGEVLDLQNYRQVPPGCMVITFEPHFWWMLGYPNIYTSWVFTPGNWRIMQQISNGCLYFDRSVDCYIALPPNSGYSDTQTECNQIFSNFTLEPVAVENYTQFGWNATMGIYKVLHPNQNFINNITAND